MLLVVVVGLFFVCGCVLVCNIRAIDITVYLFLIVVCYCLFMIVVSFAVLFIVDGCLLIGVRHWCLLMVFGYC